MWWMVDEALTEAGLHATWYLFRYRLPLFCTTYFIAAIYPDVATSVKAPSGAHFSFICIRTLRGCLWSALSLLSASYIKISVHKRASHYRRALSIFLRLVTELQRLTSTKTEITKACVQYHKNQTIAIWQLGDHYSLCWCKLHVW